MLKELYDINKDSYSIDDKKCFLDIPLDDLIEKQITLKNYTPTKGDVLFFLEGCTVPRFKIKDLCKKYNISVTRNKSKANIIIGSKTFLDSRSWGSSVPVHKLSDVYAFFDQYPVLKVDTSYGIKDYYDRLYELNVELKKNNITEAYVSFCHSFQYWLNNILENSLRGSGIEFELMPEHDVTLYGQSEKELIEAHLKGTYDQKCVLELLTDSYEQFTETDVENINNLFTSVNRDDHNLAMELLANSNYKKNAFDLLYIMMKNRTLIYNNDKIYSVNIKSLLNFFDLKRSSLCRLHLDAIIKILIEKKYLDFRTHIKLHKLITDEIGTETSYGDLYVANVALVPSDSMLEHIKSNCLDSNKELEFVNKSNPLKINVNEYNPIVSSRVN
jgi:hypothetical protein